MFLGLGRFKRELVDQCFLRADGMLAPAAPRAAEEKGWQTLALLPEITFAQGEKEQHIRPWRPRKPPSSLSLVVKAQKTRD